MPRKTKSLKADITAFVRKRLRHPAAQKYTVTVSDGNINITWQPSGPPAVDRVDALAESLLGSVALRAWVHGAKDNLRDHVPRDAPWADIHELWQHLSLEVPMSLAASTPGAFTTLTHRLRQLVAVTPAAKLHIKGKKLVCRLGIDGTSRWLKPIEVMAISITGGNGANDWEPVGIFFTKETVASMAELLEETSWNAEVRSGISVMLPGAQEPIQVCL